ncbi:MAG: hypothetical protein WBZ29_16270 [Methanocella sp.]
MVKDIKLDIKSLAATIFLAASLYVFARAGQGFPVNAIIEASFIVAIVVCLYFSYRLILIMNDVA